MNNNLGGGIEINYLKKNKNMQNQQNGTRQAKLNFPMPEPIIVDSESDSDEISQQPLNAMQNIQQFQTIQNAQQLQILPFSQIQPNNQQSYTMQTSNIMNDVITVGDSDNDDIVPLPQNNDQRKSNLPQPINIPNLQQPNNTPNAIQTMNVPNFPQLVDIPNAPQPKAKRRRTLKSSKKSLKQSFKIKTNISNKQDDRKSPTNKKEQSQPAQNSLPLPYPNSERISNTNNPFETTYDSSDSDIDIESLIQHESEEDLTDVGFQNLNILLEKADSITQKIHSKLRIDKNDPEIHVLKKYRHSIWEQIETLECNMQSNGPASSHFLVKSCSDPVLQDTSDDFVDRVEIFPEEKADIDKNIFTTISDINHKIFHHQNFRGCQAPAIEAALNRKDVFVLMPTGGGKSLVYQLVGYVEQKLTVIISPLVSLIKDQLKGLKQTNLSAVTIFGETSTEEYFEYLEQIKKEKILFLFLTPEKLDISPHLLNFLLKLYENDMITRFVIDEAHCVSQWGHDFRPSYAHLSIIRERFTNVPIMALTATATNTVKSDVKSILHIEDCLTFQMSFNRPNIMYEVREKEDGIGSYKQILTYIHEHKFEHECGIIYCMSTSDTEDLSAWLNKNGLVTKFYHAQMTNKKERHKAQDLWTNGQINIIIATLAFGMGIDKPNVRFVIHHTMPKSIEDYYQQSGRAGRDGLRSYSLLLFNLSDKERLKRLIFSDPSNNKNENVIRNEIELLDGITRFCINKQTCRRVIILNYFSENFDPQLCNESCDNCINKACELTKFFKTDVTQYAQEIAQIIKAIFEKRGDQKPYPTSSYIYKLYTSNSASKFSESGDASLPEFGKGIIFRDRKTDFHLILDELMEKQIIEYKIKMNPRGSIHYFVPTKSFENCSYFPKIEIYEEAKSVPKGMEEKDVLLYKELLECRRKLAAQHNCDPSIILPTFLIKRLVMIKPKSFIELINIPNIPRSKMERYGNIFLDVINQFESQKPRQKKLQI